MARHSKADAARYLGISRTTLYRLIQQGTLSPTPEGLIDDTELVRAAPMWTRSRHVSRRPVTVSRNVTIQAVTVRRYSMRH
jgi:helix-turn-helix protein